MGERREGQVAVETECMHFGGRFDEGGLASAGFEYQKHSKGYTTAPLIYPTRGAVHTEWTVNRLAALWTIALQRMAVPQPRTSGDVKDTFFPGDSRVSTEGKSSDLKNLKGSMLGHFDLSPIPPMAEREDVIQGLESVFLNGPIGSKFGSVFSG